MKYATQATVSVAANFLTTNVLAGLDIEWPDESGICVLKATASAVGLNCLFNINGNIQVDDMELAVGAVIPDFDVDYIARIGVVPGAHLVLQFRNTTVGALDFFFALKIG